MAVHGSSEASTWNVTLSPPAAFICSKWCSGFETMRCTSITPPAAWIAGAIARRTTGPIVIGSTKCPSPTSKWKIRAPALRRCWTCEPRLAKSAAYSDGSISTVRIQSRQGTAQAYARIRATKNPDVPWTCGSVSRNSGRRGWRNSGHAAPRSSIRRPSASTTASFSARLTVHTE